MGNLSNVVDRLKSKLQSVNKEHAELLANGTYFVLQMLSLAVPGVPVGSAAPAFGLVFETLRTKGYFDKDLDVKQREELDKIIQESFIEVTNNGSKPNGSNEVLAKLNSIISVETLITPQNEVEIENIFLDANLGELVKSFLESITQKVKKSSLLNGIYNGTQIDSINLMLHDYTQIIQERFDNIELRVENLEARFESQPELCNSSSEAFTRSDRHYQFLKNGRFKFIAIDENLFAGAKLDILLKAPNERTETIQDTIKNHEGHFIWPFAVLGGYSLQILL